jgi:hypothetical protein
MRAVPTAARSALTASNTINRKVFCQTVMGHGAAQSGAVLGAATAIALHSLCVIPQLVQQNRRRSPNVRGDQGSESIDDSSITPSQTGHGRLN